MLPPEQKRKWAEVENLLCVLEEKVKDLPLDASLSISQQLEGVHLLVDQWRKEAEHFAYFKQQQRKE